MSAEGVAEALNPRLLFADVVPTLRMSVVGASADIVEVRF